MCYGSRYTRSMPPRRHRPVIPTALLDDAAMASRSTLFLWMMDNRIEFGDVLARAGRPDWKALAETFAEQGLTDGDGKPPTPVGTRQTWWKVRRAMARKESPRASATKPPPPAAVIRAPVRHDDDLPPDDDDEPDFSGTLKD
jgi:hypothetical protein